MYYTTITNENYKELATIVSKVKDNAIANNDYRGRKFAILGRDAIDKFVQDYDVKDATKMLAEYKADGKTMARNLPCLCAEYYFDARCNKGGWCRDWAEMLVEFNGMILHPSRRRSGETTFSLSIFNDEDNEYRSFLPCDWEEKNPAPNKVGVLSDKKVAAWAEWLTMRKNAKDEAKNNKLDKVAKFRERVAQVIEQGCDICNVRENQGRIVKNGLEFSWTIQGGTISTKLEVYYIPKYDEDKLNVFEKMCKGEYESK